VLVIICFVLVTTSSAALKLAQNILFQKLRVLLLFGLGRGMRRGVDELGCGLLDAHNFVLVFGDVVVEELIKGDLKVLAILQVETLNELLSMLFF
jgi:hypothetical protein